MKRVARFLGLLRAAFATWGLWAASVGLVTLAVVVYFSVKNVGDAANFGNFVSGIASALALIWLVAGYRVQSHELALQREEIRLQRLAIEQQARELSNSARLSSLGQIQEILDQASESIRSSDLGLNHPTEILGRFMKGMETWKVILESRSPGDVQGAFFAWMKIESCARAYVRDVCAAMKLYIEFHHKGSQVDLTKPPEEFVYVYQSWVSSAPYLSAHMGPAPMLANVLFMFRPGVEALQLAGFTASAKIFDRDIVKAEAMEELRQKLTARGADLPRICEPWPFAA